MMKREELEGVIAHEISHIANYDIRFSMIAIVFVGALGLLSEFALYTLQFSILSGGGRRDRRRGGGEGIFALLAIVFVILSRHIRGVRQDGPLAPARVPRRRQRGAHNEVP